MSHSGDGRHVEWEDLLGSGAVLKRVTFTHQAGLYSDVD